MIKIEGEICQREGTLQQLTPIYFKVRHYDIMINGKPHYYYHQQTIAYAKEQLFLKGVEISKKPKKIEHRPSKIELFSFNIDLKSLI